MRKRTIRVKHFRCDFCSKSYFHGANLDVHQLSHNFPESDENEDFEENARESRQTRLANEQRTLKRFEKQILKNLMD